MRRRIDPGRIGAEAKNGRERLTEIHRAASAVAQALRHAQVPIHAEAMRVQREPFDGKGERVEAFAWGSRFRKERLWHVEITFNAPVHGPLVIGDGRFLGLGVMAPVKTVRAVHAFVVEHGLDPSADQGHLVQALRRAVMSRVCAELGPRPDDRTLPAYFSGHAPDGMPVRRERAPHLHFAFDAQRARLLVVAPHLADHREPTRDEERHLRVLDRALVDFRDLRAGPAGRLRLHPEPIEWDSDPLFAPAFAWESLAPYLVTRHTKGGGAADALTADLVAECRRRGMPGPQVACRDLHGIPKLGLVGLAALSFPVAVRGPIMLGRSRHLGGGLFEASKGRHDG